ncbi:glycosyltransferase, partial [Frankia sp. AgW1.1]|uniref:glycosyltransferase n=1 Tax=Frankia sp. AgW1.1 TaxID=1836971 RepID=UPI001EE44545
SPSASSSRSARPPPGRAGGAPHVRVVRPPELDHPGRAVRRRWWFTGFPSLVREVGSDVLLHEHGLVRGRAPGVPRAVIHHNPTPFAAETYRLYGLSAASAHFLATRQRLVAGMRRADGVVFLHESCREQITRQVRGIRATTVIGHGTPARYLDLPRAARATLPAAPRILCVTTQFLFRYQWNVVHAVCDLRDQTGIGLRLDLVGGGDAPTARRVAAAVRERRATGFVTVHGDVPAQRMPELYASGDVFVFPSGQETYGITLLEAMACGLPIACSDRMPLPDILRDAGVYFDPAHVAGMTAALRTLLADGDLRVRLGGLAQTYARQHLWQDSADQLFAFLRDLIPPASRGSVPEARRPLGAPPGLGTRP